MSELKPEPLSFAFSEAEIGNACRAAVVNRLGNPELVKAPFKCDVIVDGQARIIQGEVRVTVTLWPKRVRKPKGGKA